MTRRPIAAAFAVASLLAALLPHGLLAQTKVPTPESFFGHPIGADRKLVPYPKVLEYLRALAATSGRITIEAAGRSTSGNEMPLVILTSEENQKNLDRYRDIARRLAHPETLAEGEAKKLVAEGKTIALVTCSIHASEVGSTQMALQLAYEVATTRDPKRLAWLDSVILLLIPSINPDGQVLVIDWYEKNLGTPYEGGPLPWLYHPYVGHDNNRDFYMLTQKETQVVNEVLYHRWYPQIFLDEHQMGSVGPRMFVPPQTDPLALDVDSLIFRQADLLGTAMGMRLEEAGKLGVGSNMIFDSYWPGGTRNTGWWKNVTGLLTEVASANVGSPIYVEPGELRGGVKGLPEYNRRANFPSPWPGGWWRLRDIVEYELVATWSFLESGATYRETFLGNFYRMGREAVRLGQSEAPYAFLIPAEQHDAVAAARLVDLLLRHGVRVERAQSAFTLGRTVYPAGSYVVPAAQPYRSFLLTMLRPQRYPQITPYVGGPVLPPYDVTTWSLPLSMGVDVEEAAIPLPAGGAGGGIAPIEAPVWPGGAVAEGAGGYLIPHRADSAAQAVNRLLADGKKLYWLQREGQAVPSGGASAPGDYYLPATESSAAALGKLSTELHVPILPLGMAPVGPALAARAVKVGLYKPWVASTDEGWTRFLLERYGFPYENLSNAQMKEGAYRGKDDVLLLPAIEPEVIEKGGSDELRAQLPPPYSGGLGIEGGAKLKSWVEEGGTLVALDASARYVIGLFGLPVRNVLDKVPAEDFLCPGSMLHVRFDTAQPLAYGMRADEEIYFGDSPAFETRVPDARFDRKVVATYPDNAEDILASGYLKGGKRLERRAAVVDLTVGKGRIVLIGFHPQHRAQPYRTFKLLWNALYAAGLKETELK